MAASRQDFEEIIKLTKQLNKELIKTGEAASNAFRSIGDGETLKDIKEAEKAIDNLNASTEELRKSKLAESKLNQQLAKQRTDELKTSQQLTKNITENTKAKKEEVKLEQEELKLKIQVSKEEERLNKTREKAKKILTDKEKIQEKINKATSEEGKELAILSAELKKVNAENRKNAKNLSEQNDSYKVLVKNTNEAQAEFKKLAAELGVTDERTKDARKEFEKFDNKLREINEQAKDGRRDVGRYRQEVGKLADELKGAANDAGGFGDIISKVTSPVGIATSIVGGLGAAFSSTEEGGNKLKDGLAGLKGGFNAVVSSSGGFINSLIEGSSISEAYADNVDGVTKRIKEQAEANVEATQLSRQNRKDLRFESEALATLRGEYELLQQQSGDATTTLEAQNEATIKAQEKAAEIAEQELKVIQKQIDGIDLQISARKGLNNQDLLDERQEFVNQQIELEGTLNAEVAALGQERRQIEQDQWEQRLDFLFDASDRQKSITERQLQDESVATDKRIEKFNELRVSILKTYAQIEQEFRDASGQQINIAEIANLEATEQAELLKTLNLSEIERTRLKEAVVEYLAVTQDLKETNEDLIDAEKRSLQLQKEIELQRRKLIDSNFDLEQALTDFKKEQLRQQIEDLEEYSIERLEKEKELNDLLLKEEKSKAESTRKLNTTSGDEALANVEKQNKEDEAKKKEQAEAQKELTDATLNFIENSTQKASAKRISALDEELDAITSQQSRLQALADNGNEDAFKSLVAAQKREAEIREEKNKELQRQKLIEAGLTAFKVFAAKTEAGDSNALGNTITDLTTLSAFISGLQGFYEGTENTGSKGFISDKDGVITGYTHKNERVITEKDNKKIGGLSNEKLTNIADMYNKGLLVEQLPQFEIKQERFQSNAELLNEVRAMQDILKNLHKKMPSNSTSFDAFRGALMYSEKKGNNTINKGYIID